MTADRASQEFTARCSVSCVYSLLPARMMKASQETEQKQQLPSCHAGMHRPTRLHSFTTRHKKTRSTHPRRTPAVRYVNSCSIHYDVVQLALAPTTVVQVQAQCVRGKTMNDTPYLSVMSPQPTSPAQPRNIAVRTTCCRPQPTHNIVYLRRRQRPCEDFSRQQQL